MFLSLTVSKNINLWSFKNSVIILTLLPTHLYVTSEKLQDIVYHICSILKLWGLHFLFLLFDATVLAWGWNKQNTNSLHKSRCIINKSAKIVSLFSSSFGLPCKNLEYMSQNRQDWQLFCMSLVNNFTAIAWKRDYT